MPPPLPPSRLFFPEAVFSPAESLLLICCCFSKTRQFGAINPTEFGQIIVKCKMRSQHALLFLRVSLQLAPCRVISLESEALRCSLPCGRHDALSPSPLCGWRSWLWREDRACTRFSMCTTCSDSIPACPLGLQKTNILPRKDIVCVFSVHTHL